MWYYKVPMPYNIHPIFVHFPIAFLVFYSAVKILPFERWFPKVAWRHIELALLLVGVVGALIADSTGDLAEELTQPDRALVNMHATFAVTASWVYGVLLLGEFLAVLNVSVMDRLVSPGVKTISVKTEKVLTHSLLSKVLALLGLFTISLTGLLGGVMVYGTSADPFAQVVLTWLGL